MTMFICITKTEDEEAKKNLDCIAQVLFEEVFDEISPIFLRSSSKNILTINKEEIGSFKYVFTTELLNNRSFLGPYIANEKVFFLVEGGKLVIYDIKTKKFILLKLKIGNSVLSGGFASDEKNLYITAGVKLFIIPFENFGRNILILNNKEGPILSQPYVFKDFVAFIDANAIRIFSLEDVFNKKFSVVKSNVVNEIKTILLPTTSRKSRDMNMIFDDDLIVIDSNVQISVLNFNSLIEEAKVVLQANQGIGLKRDIIKKENLVFKKFQKVVYAFDISKSIVEFSRDFSCVVDFGLSNTANKTLLYVLDYVEEKEVTEVSFFDMSGDLIYKSVVDDILLSSFSSESYVLLQGKENIFLIDLEKQTCSRHRMKCGLSLSNIKPVFCKDDKGKIFAFLVDIKGQLVVVEFDL